MFRWRAMVGVLSAGMLAIYAILFFQMRQPLRQGYSDFVSFYTAGKILDRGASSQLYDIPLQYQIQRAVAPNVQIRQNALPFVRPAYEAWLFWPLACLPYGVAFALWNLFNGACLILAVLCLRHEVPALHGISPLLTVAASLSYFPVFFTILQGQDSILILLIYVLAYRALRRNRQFVGGMTLGLGIFKFPLVIPFLIPFFSRKRLPFVFGFALTSFVLAAASIATVGLSTSAYYPRYLLNIDHLARGINRPADMPNLRGLLSVLLPATSARAGVVLLILFSVVLLAFVFRKWPVTSSPSTSSSVRPGPDTPPETGAAFALGFALNVVATVLVSYHCHAFDWSVLLLPMGLVLGLVLSDEPSFPQPTSRQATLPEATPPQTALLQAIQPQTRKFLVWTLSALWFSPIYLLIVFTANTPSLLAVLLIAFAVAIGLAISPPLMPIQKQIAARS